MSHPDDLIRRIHQQGKQFVLAFTGGGNRLHDALGAARDTE